MMCTGHADGNAADLEQTLEAKQTALHVALLNSFDTQTAMSEISSLTTAYNLAYMEQRTSEATSTAIGAWITKIVVIFGLDAHYKVGQMGWSGLDLPVGAEPFVHQLSELRDRVCERAKAAVRSQIDVGVVEDIQSRNSFAAAYTKFQRLIATLQARDAGSNEYLVASDNLRDSTLWDLGVYIEDLHTGRGLVRPISDTLREHDRQSRAIVAEKLIAKQKAQAEAAAAERARLEKGKLSHKEMCRVPDFTAWDENGLPTKDSEGKEWTKSKAKKVQKDWERQMKFHVAYLASLHEPASADRCEAAVAASPH